MDKNPIFKNIEWCECVWMDEYGATIMFDWAVCNEYAMSLIESIVNSFHNNSYLHCTYHVAYSCYMIMYEQMMNMYKSMRGEQLSNEWRKILSESCWSNQTIEYVWCMRLNLQWIEWVSLTSSWTHSQSYYCMIDVGWWISKLIIMIQKNQSDSESLTAILSFIHIHSFWIWISSSCIASIINW